jgi:hypothetical protein
MLFASSMHWLINYSVADLKAGGGALGIRVMCQLYTLLFYWRSVIFVYIDQL